MSYKHTSQFHLLTLEQDLSYSRVQVRINNSPPSALFSADPHSKFSWEYPTDLLSGVTRMYPTRVSVYSMYLVWGERCFLYSKAGQRKKVLAG